MVAASVANEILKDKENQALIRKGVVKTVETGASVLKYTWIAVGSLAGIAVLIWGVTKISENVKKAKEKMAEAKRLADNKAEAETKIKNELNWFPNAIEKLKSSMGGCKEKFNKWGTDYNCEKILAVLKELKTKYDWAYLCAEFGMEKDHSLQDWLGCDGSSDIADYNKVLTELGVSESDLIHKIGVFAGAESNLLIK